MKLLLGCLALLNLYCNALSAPLTSEFTYQGRLLDGGGPANGSYDLEFTLFNLPMAGSPIGATLVKEDIFVQEGLFTVQLDFGENAFNQDARWLAMGVRPGASTGAFVQLPMRQGLVAVPQSQYALIAGSVRDGAVTATKIAVGAVTTEKIQNGAVTAEKIGANQVVKSINSLNDNVTLSGGANVSVNTTGSQIVVSVADGNIVKPQQVMGIVLDQDGIGSGLSADFIDGIDSANLARKTEVQDRVLKDGDTMIGALTVSVPEHTQGLMVNGKLRTSSGLALAHFKNDQAAEDGAPALRVENTGGRSPTGALSVANKGEGFIARFENGSRDVAALNTAGTLELLPNDNNAALRLMGNSLVEPLLELRQEGFGSLMTLGNSTETKFKVDYSGGVDMQGALTMEGPLHVGSNARIVGDLAARNMPFIKSVERFKASRAELDMLPNNEWVIVDELEITVPTACDLVINAHVKFGGVARPTSSGRAYFQFELLRLDLPGDPVLLGGGGEDAEPDVYGHTRSAKYDCSRVLRILEPRTIRLQTKAVADTGGDGIGILTSAITAIYFPLPQP